MRQLNLGNQETYNADIRAKSGGSEQWLMTALKALAYDQAMNSGAGWDKIQSLGATPDADAVSGTTPALEQAAQATGGYGGAMTPALKPKTPVNPIFGNPWG